MPAINDNALSKYVGILEVAPQASPGSLVRIASVRGLTAKYDNTKNQVDIKADDTGTVFKGFLGEATIEGSFLENVDRDLIKLLVGGDDDDVAGSIVNNHVQTIAQPLVYNLFYPLEFQNGNGTLPNIDSVVGSTDGALVLATDYAVTKDSDGKWGITLIAGGAITTLAQSVAVQFDYTPNASESLTIPLEFTEAPRLYVKITAENADGDQRTIILDDCTFDGSYDLEFLDVVEAGDIKGTTFTFKGNKGSNMIINNEIL